MPLGTRTTKSATASPTPSLAPAQLRQALRSSLGSGRRIEPRIAEQMGGTQGLDFSGVRIHADARAAELTKATAARAFTWGQHVFFSPGSYRPDRPEGRRLLAHELGHVSRPTRSAGADFIERDCLGEGWLVFDYTDNERTRAFYHADQGHVRRRADRFASGDANWQYCVAAHVIGETTYYRVLRRPNDSHAQEGQPPPEQQPDQSAPEQQPAPDQQPTPEQQPDQQPDTTAELPSGGENAQTEAPTPTTPVTGAASHVGGYAGGDLRGTWRIAWTFDDGPTAVSDDVVATVAATPTVGTWYIMNDRLRARPGWVRNINRLKGLQSLGHEMAVHSYHPSVNHACWFPAQNASCGAGYTDMATSMQALTDFTGLLRTQGLTVRFVRLPNGLITQLKQYLEDAPARNTQPTKALARSIIAGSATVGSLNTHETQVVADYRMLQQTLQSLGLHLWGDAGGTSPEITAQSWEIESSGVSGRTDSLNPGWIGTKIANILARRPPEGFTVILAHDLSSADDVAVQADMTELETQATANHLRLEYYTMSNLYQVARGTAP